MSFMIECKNLKKIYPTGRVGIDSVSFSVKEKSVVAYLGPNGAGKTTTLNILSTLLKADSGSCFINGVDINKEEKKVREIIGYLPESFGLYPSLTVYQNLEFFARLRGFENPEERINDLLELMDLKDRRDEKATRLSKGLTQRVGLAIAMIGKPEVLLLDEPTNGLDPNSAKKFLKTIEELNREGTTILFSTHILSIAEKVCDEVIIIDGGKTLLNAGIDNIKKELKSKNLEEVYFKITEGADGYY